MLDHIAAGGGGREFSLQRLEHPGRQLHADREVGHFGVPALRSTTVLRCAVWPPCRYWRLPLCSRKRPGVNHSPQPPQASAPPGPAGKLAYLSVAHLGLEVGTYARTPPKGRSRVVALPLPGDHASPAGAGARTGGTPIRPVPVHHPHGGQLRQGAALTLGAPLLQATLCPVQERNEEAAAAALVQGIRMAGESLAHVLRGETGSQLRGRQGLLGPCSAFRVPPRLQDTVTQPAHRSVGPGGQGG